MYSLDDALQVVIPYLPATLVPPDALPALRQLARTLAPSHWGGFECRLGENRTRVDFHQGITTHDDDLTILDNYISSTALIDNDRWRSIREFCARLKFPSSPMYGKVIRIVLEFDDPDLTVPIPAPSLFIGLDRNRPAKEILTAAETALELFLNPPVILKLSPNLRRCFDACPGGANINDVGIMLSRPSETVRINVGGVSQMQIQGYLADIGWEGDATDVEAIFSQLSALVDHMVLCLDIGEKVYPKIGLECFIDKTPDETSGWVPFLDRLVESGLCTSAKRDALLAWSGYSDPTICPEHWPGNLIVESMLKPADKLSLFYRNLNHIKIICQPDHPPEAKGYIGFRHDWTDIRKRLRPDPNLEDLFTEDDPRIDIERSDGKYMKQVRAYYDSMTEHYLKNLGTSIQAFLFKSDSGGFNATASNLYMASRAGIRSGQHILDAGCGICGPAIDIAKSTGNIQIDSITNSTVQAKIAGQKIKEANLSDRVRIHVADYHQMAFSDAVFDIVVFFESSGYSYDQHKLFLEAYRVLKPGGTLYIKDVFRLPDPLTSAAMAELKVFDRIYVQRTATMEQTAKEAKDAGFQYVQSRDLTRISSLMHFNQAMGDSVHGEWKLTELGKRHDYPFQCLPVFLGEISGHKPE